jgi:hypothetical protein
VKFPSTVYAIELESHFNKLLNVYRVYLQMTVSTQLAEPLSRIIIPNTIQDTIQKYIHKTGMRPVYYCSRG